MSDLNARWAALLEAGKAEWVAGMRSQPDATGRVWRAAASATGPRLHQESGRRLRSLPPPWEHLTPDWTDAATLGALLGQVRQRYGDTGIHMACRRPSTPDMSGIVPPSWYVADGVGRKAFPWLERSDTEPGALLAALEAR